ncbi:HAD family hydrolase [Streptomyces sp. TRM 70351]|uniref:HAD family hydrolase n=1 Tax=Streptomyces sp. TRM 70351 TaxID=3116552 RepID=UPI002E7C283B|nr:HAD family hydrolase [Streptomyces sp. TRM 70351]MEE1926712.1 HAD family hydrolase [Streptomyces sp. TRM 70351]
MRTESADPAPRAALFDVDGTLVDTNYLHVVAWWEAFRQAGHPVPMADVHRAVGMGADRLPGHLLGDEGERLVGEQVRQAHSVLYATYFPTLTPLPGAAGLLRAVADAGWRVVLASSASGAELAAMRAALDVDEVIHDAASGDDVDVTKPAPDLVRQAVRLAGVAPERAVFVGDTVWDMRACGDAGVPAVGVLSGGVPRADLEAAGAVRVYAGPAELLDRLDTSPLARPRS